MRISDKSFNNKQISNLTLIRRRMSVLIYIIIHSSYNGNHKFSCRLARGNK